MINDFFSCVHSAKYYRCFPDDVIWPCWKGSHTLGFNCLFSILLLHIRQLNVFYLEIISCLGKGGYLFSSCILENYEFLKMGCIGARKIYCLIFSLINITWNKRIITFYIPVKNNRLRQQMTYYTSHLFSRRQPDKNMKNN